MRTVRRESTPISLAKVSAPATERAERKTIPLIALGNPGGMTSEIAATAIGAIPFAKTFVARRCRTETGTPLKPFDSVLVQCLPGVEGPLSLLRPRGPELLQRGIDSVAREIVFVAQHVPDAVRVGIAELNVDVGDDVRFQEDLPHLTFRLDVDPELRERGLERSMFLDQRERLLRSDSFDALVEVRADQEAHVDELFSGEAEARQRRVERDLLRLHVDVDVLSR